jgi:tetratricopeptide (TPR) repeat protein
VRAANQAELRSSYDRKSVIAVCVLLAGIVLLVFWPTIGAGFLNYDDNDYVYDNPHVTNGLTLDGIRWAFTHFHAANWHPLTTISHMMDCQLYGLQPWGHHLTNVLLHATAAILLFLALLRLTSRSGSQLSTLNPQLQTAVIDRRYSFWASAFVAALFAVHPLRVESVAWISERKDVLSGVFFSLTLWAYARYAREDRHRSRNYALVIVCFALGLLCKPTLVTLPFVLLLLDYWPLQRMQGAGSKKRGAKSDARRGRSQGRSPSAFQHFSVSAFSRLILEKVPLLAMSSASSVITMLAQRGALAGNTELWLPDRVMNALIAYVTYLKQTVFPFNLAAVYPYPQGQLHVANAFLAGIFLLFLTLIFFWQRSRRPFLVVGWLWFLGMLVPMIGLVQVGPQSMADRYTYLPTIGFYIFATWAGIELLHKWHRGFILKPVAILIIGLLAVRSFLQTQYWHDSETLWRHTIEVTSSNYVAENGLANTFFESGRLEYAATHYQAALSINPKYPPSHSNLANVLLRKHQPDEAIVHLNQAIEVNPNYAEAYNNLGSAFMQKEQLSDAIANYEKAVQFKPDYADAYNNLGVAHLQQGDVDTAIEEYKKAVAINPASPDIQYNLGNAYARKSNWNDAITAYETAIRVRPDSAKTHNNLGVALKVVGKLDQAFEQFSAALEINPDYPEAHCNLGSIFAQQGRRNEAVSHLNEALRLRPGYEEAKQQLNALTNKN